MSKNPFYKGNGIPCHLSGYTVGFVAPVIEHLLRRNHAVAFLSPFGSNISPLYYRYFPREPESHRFLHISLKPKKIPKVPFKFPELETKANIMAMETALGAIDIALSVYVFPWIIPIVELRNRLNYKIAAFLRGSDLIYGCDPNSSYSSIFEHSSSICPWEKMTELMRISLKNCDKVYTVSRFQASIARNLGIRVDGIFPSFPFKRGKKLRYLKKSKKEIRLDFAKRLEKHFEYLDPNLQWVVYLGRISKEKCIDLLIRSVRKSKNRRHFQLLIAGDGPDLPNLRRLASKLCVKTAFGFVSPSLVPLLVKAASVVVHPTLPSHFIDAAPSSCINASFVGSPVVFPYRHSSPCSGIHEYVSNKNTAVLSFDPNQGKQELTENIAEKIDLMVENHDLRSLIEQENIKHTRQLDPEDALLRFENELLRVVNT